MCEKIPSLFNCKFILFKIRLFIDVMIQTQFVTGTVNYSTILTKLIKYILMSEEKIRNYKVANTDLGGADSIPSFLLKTYEIL